MAHVNVICTGVNVTEDRNGRPQVGISHSPHVLANFGLHFLVEISTSSARIMHLAPKKITTALACLLLVISCADKDKRTLEANAGSDQRVKEGETVTLSAWKSFYPSTENLSFQWRQESGTPIVSLNGADQEQADFIAPSVQGSNTDFIFKLTVFDKTSSDSDTVTITVFADDPFSRWNSDLTDEPWEKDSKPYKCNYVENPESPWRGAGLIDLGGQDSLSLIRYFKNGSYLRYSMMGLSGCVAADKYSSDKVYFKTPPIDPTYYSIGSLVVGVDIARVPPTQGLWGENDDGVRTEFTMSKAVNLLNTHISSYYNRISEGDFQISFEAGHDFTAEGTRDQATMEAQHLRELRLGIENGAHESFGTPGALNRILFHDVTRLRLAGVGYNGLVTMALSALAEANMDIIVHEIGHAWMSWPHSYSEVPLRSGAGFEIQEPNPYSNFYDIMSSLDVTVTAWDGQNMPSTLAINRYSAGWIDPPNVALHLGERGTYTLSPPGEAGKQFLVIHSNRPYAFTTLEVLEDRHSSYKRTGMNIYDSSAPQNERAVRYEGVLVSRYDQSTGTGLYARFGPAFYNENNPNFLDLVGSGFDDTSVIQSGETLDLTPSVSAEVTKNNDGSYEVTISGGKVAEFPKWCRTIQSSHNSDPEFDTDCFLDEAVWANAGTDITLTSGGGEAVLDGSKSYGPVSRFQWSQIGGTPTVTLSTPASSSRRGEARFTAPASTSELQALLFRLTVFNDDETRTSTDDVIVIIPIASSQ